MKNVLVVILCFFATIAAWSGFLVGKKEDSIGYKIGAMLPSLFLVCLATWIGRKPKKPERNPSRRRERDDRDYDDDDRPRRRRERDDGGDDADDRPRRRRR